VSVEVGRWARRRQRPGRLVWTGPSCREVTRTGSRPRSMWVPARRTGSSPSASTQSSWSIPTCSTTPARDRRTWR